MIMVIAEQIDKELTSRQRARLTKGNIIKIFVAIIFYLTIMVLFIISGV